MDYYVVTAVSEERNVSCNATSNGHGHSCSVSLGNNANDYNFTVYGAIRVNDSYIYNGSATDCSEFQSLYDKVATIFFIRLAVS